ncbi:MAG: hypothetical protein AAF614_27200 [Chloroflexota bacterium]
MQQERVEAIKDESALFGAMEAERRVKAQREEAKRVLAQRRQELGQLMARCDMRFSSLTPVEEVMEAHTRTQALRWLIECIEREVDELNLQCHQHRDKVQQLLN